MRRVLGMLFVIILASTLACRTLSPLSVRTQTAPIPTSTSVPSVTPSPSVTVPPSATVSPTLEPTTTDTPVTTPAESVAYEVRVHPDGGLYVGDQVSFEVIAPPGMPPTDQRVSVRPDEPRAAAQTSGFGLYGIQGRNQATFTWVWDTRGVAPGAHEVIFSIQPGGQTWTQTVTLLPGSDLPWPEPEAHWATAHSECCTLHYITGTAAERDLPELLAQADEQARLATESMGIEFSEPITITLMPRVLGHGGFASDEIHISYLDRNYAGSDFGMVLHHEMIHILDYRLGGDLRPSLFQEGLAVFLSGGHFKPEPLLPRAAALLNLGEGGNGWYIPLTDLAEAFYPAQHEIGYLEGGSLIEYMVNRWGWDAFSAFYRDIHPAPGNGPISMSIDLALKAHFDLGFDDLEQDFLTALRQQQPDDALRDDLRLTVTFYDTVRRYQQALDPSAYFMTAWLVDSREMRRRGIVADFLRHPAAPENLAMETLLVTADETLRSGRYEETQLALDAAAAVLDAMGQGDANPFAAHPLAADYAAITSRIASPYTATPPRHGQRRAGPKPCCWI